MERSFPRILAEEVNRRAGGEVVCEPVSIGAVRDDKAPPYDLILDRISHEVPFYRTFLKQCCHAGVQVINNPFWFSADDKYFGNVVARGCGVAVPRTALLPHKQHPAGTESESFTNLSFPLPWEQIFGHLGFPIYLKPSSGGGWKHVYRCADPAEFLAAYEKSDDLCMMAQEEIVFSEYFRCYVIGREKVQVMRYDPKAPHHLRYVRNGPPIEPDLLTKLEDDCLKLCRALGYDFNTVELAVRDGVPYAIDFTNPCPDADVASVGEENFAWVVENAAEFLLQRVKEPRAFEMTGTWPEQTR
jgi:glutathione synthase/RimK-type ligase-like ATP-grasp enzyme